jgi:ferric-dicitrate binding protein FerR (iron transport regulator)
MKKNSTIKPKFKQLLAKFHEGKCSLNELYELQAFFEKDELSEVVKQQMFFDVEQQDYPVTEQFQSQQVFAKLKEQIRKNQRKTEERAIPVLWKIAKVAAVVLLSFVLGGLAVHFLNSEEKATAVTYTEVLAPLGAKSKVILPDQSVVWLNAGSKIKYSTNFNKNERHVSLVGEGYFQIEKNKYLPFMVNALGFLVEAVGTEFNIQAYEEESTIETILVEGKVRLAHQTESIAEDTYLGANSKASFFKEADPALRDGQPRLVINTNIDPFPLISWKDDRFIFKSELLKDLVVVLGRKYNFTFKFDSEEVQNYRFTGTLEDETLQQVMDVITITSPISYEIEGKVVRIKKDINRTKKFRKY